MDASLIDRRLQVVSLAAGAAFVVLALVVAWRPEPLAWERHLAGGFEHLDGVVGRAWKLGSAVVVVPGLIVSLGIAITRRRPIAVGLALVAGPAIAVAQYVVKPLVGRPAGLVFGFPSGHAMGSGFLAVALVAALWSDAEARNRMLLGVATVGLVCCGAAAISSGSHWPSDVVGGWLWVTCWSAATALGVTRCCAASSKVTTLSGIGGCGRHAVRSFQQWRDG